ncbi:MAG TPA: 2Fe-2S iron-sulfur cluster-binding protein [Actinomycetota bacterium]|nr:2Fe-2S iron-sulfur cluster-binding protein [Actinomycetota bacterium]
MSGRRLAAPAGHGIDRTRPLGFSFDGGPYEALAGDTIASALIANGVDVVAHSPLLGRPRGVFSAGVEEPNAFVEVSAPFFRPIEPATTIPLVDGLVAISRAGLGRLPTVHREAPAADHRHQHVETLVVGGGIAGLRAAVEAAEAGDRVLLVDERSWLGGAATTGDDVDGDPALPWIATTGGALSSASEVTVLTDATALGVYDDGYVVVYERCTPTERLHHVRAKRVVLATGAHERPIGFARNDLPGVMLASSALLYADRFGVLPGERAIVFSTNHAGHQAAVALSRSGLDVVAIVDPGEGGRASEAAREAGIDVRTGWQVLSADGDARVRTVALGDLDGETETIEADLVLVSGGWNPAAQLWRGIGGGLRWHDERACFVPDGDAPRWLSIVGAAAGEVPASVPYWYSPADDLSEHFVELQRDSTVADVLDAVAHELRSTEHVKRATYIGTAIDQGRTSGVLTAAIVNEAWGADPGAQGPTNSRPPYTPVPYSVLAGPDRGPALLDPVRSTPMHERHVERGAAFENVGQWKRPWYFPLPGESMHAAVDRECLAVRHAAGAMDASTLGRIELWGPGTAAFLDRLYTNRMSTLAVGSIRYGLMLGLDGMVWDDGVAMRLDDDRFLITTTTGGAARVMDQVEEWLQTEWPDLQVYATSVTEQWATIAVNGPLARDVLDAAGADIDLDSRVFPFMTWRDGEVAGMPARVARVSFSGELAYEINVAGYLGLAMWDALLAAGTPFGLTPYGTEAMHVLRAEKGFVIVGQDTDGTVTPHDLGMSWIVRKDDSDFIGRRSLRRADTMRPDRKHLVGLLPVDPSVWLPEGAQLVSPEHAATPPPVPMLGHVTSSYRSPVLDRTFALAMVRGGRDRIGGRVVSPTPRGPVECEVVTPAFYDPEGERRDG